ncbi:hypothetical protein V5O48_016074 [Marasmius crinis-equi]|uniref:Uncharacterized protein n=1 Tax=Marasmius crinis-equi TaxID=585013 RepID=A0ABR3EST1_9AGAR
MEHNSALSTNDLSVVAQDSTRAVKKPFIVNVESPEAAKQIQEYVRQALLLHFGPTVNFEPFVLGLTSGFETLQGLLNFRTARMKDFEKKHGVLVESLKHSLSRNTAFEKLHDQYRRSIEDQKAEILMLEKRLADLLGEVGSLKSVVENSTEAVTKAVVDKDNALKELGMVARRLTWASREGIKYRRGNPIHAFPDVESRLRRIYFELSGVSARFNRFMVPPGTGELGVETQHEELKLAISHSMHLAEETLEFFQHVESASKQISGNMSSETSVERELTKAAGGFKARHLLEIVSRYAKPSFISSAVRPFKVNTSPLRSFLKRAHPVSPASSDGTEATDGSSEDWRSLASDDE